MKTQEDFQRELYQLFAQSGEIQFMLRMFRKTIEDKNNELSTLNQKIERTQVNFRTFLDNQKKPQQADPVVENTTSGEAVAIPDQNPQG